MGMGLNTAYDVEQAKMNSGKLLSMLVQDFNRQNPSYLLRTLCRRFDTWMLTTRNKVQLYPFTYCNIGQCFLHESEKAMK